MSEPKFSKDDLKALAQTDDYKPCQVVLEVQPNLETKTCTLVITAKDMPPTEAWHLAQHFQDAMEDYIEEIGGIGHLDEDIRNVMTGEKVSHSEKTIGEMPTTPIDPKKVN